MTQQSSYSKHIEKASNVVRQDSNYDKYLVYNLNLFSLSAHDKDFLTYSCLPSFPFLQNFSIRDNNNKINRKGDYKLPKKGADRHPCIFQKLKYNYIMQPQASFFGCQGFSQIRLLNLYFLLANILLLTYPKNWGQKKRQKKRRKKRRYFTRCIDQVCQDHRTTGKANGYCLLGVQSSEAPKPPGSNVTIASALPISFLFTAKQCLVGAIQPGSTCCIV